MDKLSIVAREVLSIVTDLEKERDAAMAQCDRLYNRGHEWKDQYDKLRARIEEQDNGAT